MKANRLSNLLTRYMPKLRFNLFRWTDKRHKPPAYVLGLPFYLLIGGAGLWVGLFGQLRLPLILAEIWFGVPAVAYVYYLLWKRGKNRAYRRTMRLSQFQAPPRRPKPKIDLVKIQAVQRPSKVKEPTESVELSAGK